MAITFKEATRSCAKGSKQFSTCNVSKTFGLCASSPDTDSEWCCPPESERCYGQGQRCTGGTDNNLAGPGQVFCSTTSGKTRWCCDSGFEICVEDDSKYNICHTKFKNPMSNITEQDAARLRAESLATISSSSALPTTIGSTSSLQSSSASLTATNVGQEASTPTPSSSQIPAASGSSISGGAIAGIAIGAVAGIAIVLAGIFILMKRKRETRTGPEKGAAVYEAYGSDVSAQPVISTGGGQNNWVADGKTYGGSPPAYNQPKVELPSTQPPAELQ